MGGLLTYLTKAYRDKTFNALVTQPTNDCLG